MGDTLVCDEPIAARLAAVGWRWGPPGSKPPQGRAPDAVRLFYLRLACGGHFGVLCEAGEWIAPAGGAGSAFSLIAPDESPGLPSLDDFIGTLLVLTGQADGDEDEA